MVHLHTVKIDHGDAIITVKELKSAAGKTFYEGRMFDTDGIQIFDDSKEECIKKLTKAIDHGLKFWLMMQLSELGIFMSKD